MKQRDRPFAFHGNMTSDGTKTYYWNALDRLVGVRIPGYEEDIDYYGFYYDGLGRRIRITHEDADDHSILSETWYLWDKLAIAQERGTQNGSPYRWHFDQGYLTNSPGEDVYDEPSYFKKDHLGSIRAVYTSSEISGDLDQFYSYDAYGNFEEQEYDVPHPGFQKMFTGHFFHRGTGLYLAPYRAYDPQIGRWLSREPLGLDGPNLYHYSSNSPVILLDITGLADIYFGGNIEDTIGIGGTAGIGFFIDTENWLDSGFYSTAGLTFGVNAGVGFTVGMASELSGRSQGMNVTYPGAVGVGWNWNDCGDITGGNISWGLGAGASYNVSQTGTVTISDLWDYGTFVANDFGHDISGWVPDILVGL